MDGWMNITDPLDSTLTYNQYVVYFLVHLFSVHFVDAGVNDGIHGRVDLGRFSPWERIVYAITIGQQYLMENTTLGIPTIIQSKGDIFCHTEPFSRFRMSNQAFMGSRTTEQRGHPQSVLPHPSTLARGCQHNYHRSRRAGSLATVRSRSRPVPRTSMG